MADNFHSQFVGWAKIILPLSALALLSTIFLFARQTGPDPDIPFSQIEALAREQRISSPQFSGVTDGGAEISVSAQNARPNPATPAELEVEGLAITLSDPIGGEVNVTSGKSIINGRTQTARLDGLARLTTSTGYQMETTGLQADLRSGEITSEGALEIHAPFGQLTAGRIKITLSRDGEGQQMLFTDGVKLLYTPSGAQGTRP